MKNLKYSLVLIFAALLVSCATNDDKSTHQDVLGEEVARPKLVVGIIVDQMRPEYLYRFYSKYGQGGFKRLMSEGFVNKNTHYNYIPTFTGPGHASVYTGTTPEIHGIIGNDWYSRSLKRSIYCAEDSTVSSTGSNGKEGKMSPRNMLTTTITDELKLSTNYRSKIIGISIKDRGAIMPAGHMADAAYWYDHSSGKFITSSFYMNELPSWLKDFNDLNVADQYLDGIWNPLLPIEQYVESSKDNTPYEKVFAGKETPEFPYNLKELSEKSNKYDLLTKTPFGNSILTDVAYAALQGENLGKGKFTDFLAISYSSPDKIGHDFGLRSIELQDTYLRLDSEIEGLLNYLDKEIGKGNYLVFLTADHAAVENPAFMIDQKVPAGYYKSIEIKEIVNDFISKKYGKNEWVSYIINEQIYLNRSLIYNKNLDLDKIQHEVATFTLNLNGISNAFAAVDMQRNNYTEGLAASLKRGYNPKRSGDVLMIFEPGWIKIWSTPQGADHGSGYAYDTHVPLLWYGWGINKGESVKHQNITDIAPTISMLLNINIPNGSIGSPILEVIKSKP
jgi:predicted AlkP superfamily pyrophosphatase or phosphodiesterase